MDIKVKLHMRRRLPVPSGRPRFGRKHSVRLESAHQSIAPDVLLNEREATLARNAFKAGQGAESPDLQRVASEVLGRRLGLRKYMVVDIRRTGGFELVMQVLGLTITNATWGWPPLRWKVSGRSLRKDGTVGSKPISITFAEATVVRRTLAGEWIRLLPSLRCKRSRHEPGPR